MRGFGGAPDQAKAAYAPADLGQHGQVGDKEPAGRIVGMILPDHDHLESHHLEGSEKTVKSQEKAAKRQ